MLSNSAYTFIKPLHLDLRNETVNRHLLCSITESCLKGMTTLLSHFSKQMILNRVYLCVSGMCI